MKKLFLNSAIACMAMFAMSISANAEETTVNEKVETIEETISDNQNAEKPVAQEIEEVVIYQRPDGSVYIVHTHTMQVKK